MNTYKYIELLENSKTYEGLLTLGRKSGALYDYTRKNNFCKYISTETTKGDTIKLGVYRRINGTLKVETKYDGIDIVQFNSEDKISKQYLLNNAFIIFLLNRNCEYDERIWKFVFNEIWYKFRNIVEGDIERKAKFAVRLACACEEIMHDQIEDGSLAEKVLKSFQKTQREKKATNKNRQWKLAFDREIYENSGVEAKDGRILHRKLEKKELMKIFEEVWPQCSTKEEVIEKMEETICSSFSDKMYKDYKKELFPNETKQHKKHEVMKTYETGRKQHEKTVQQKNKEQQKIEYIKQQMELYGKEWKKNVETKYVTWYKRHRDLF